MLARDARGQQGAYEDLHVAEAVARRDAGGERAELLGDDPLQGRDHGHGPVERPGGDLATGEGDDVAQTGLNQRTRVAVLMRAAHPGVVGTVHADQRAAGAELGVEVRPELLRPQMARTRTGDEQVGLRTGQDREAATEGAHAKHRAETLVLPREKGADVAGEREGVTSEGKPRRRGRNRGRRGHGERLRTAATAAKCHRPR